MRLSLDLIEHSPAFTNTVGDRELDLRGKFFYFLDYLGNKIVAIENLSATRDLYDTIDLSNNEIKRLENVPPLNRLKNLFLSNNGISKIDPSISQRVPFLQMLILTGNSISELTDLVPLAGWSSIGGNGKYASLYKPSLETLSLLDNPVTKKPNYRLFLISIVPSLKVLDYSKERRAAAALLSTGSFTTSESPASQLTISQDEYSEEKKERMKTAIAQAKSLDEIRYLERAFASGYIPDIPNK